MKKILTIALILAAFATANAQTNTTVENTDKKAAQTEKVSQAPAATPATKDATAAKEDNLSMYVGTNDANIALIREGVRKG